MPTHCPFCGHKLKLFERNIDMLIMWGCLNCGICNPKNGYMGCEVPKGFKY